MSDISIELLAQPGFWLSKEEDDSDTKYRLGIFAQWLEKKETIWFNCNLAEFRDDLLQAGYASSSVSAIMGTLRMRIRSFTYDNQFAAWFRNVCQDQGMNFDQTETRLIAMLRQIANIADARNSPVKQQVRQDETDEQRLWINGSEKDFIRLIGEDKPPYVLLRDRAVVALFLATGVRREELSNLTGEDIVQRYQKRPACLVRHGKGDKQRMVIYGDLWEKYIVPFVMPWMSFSGSYTEPFFQGFWRGNQKLRARKLHVATVNAIIASAPLEIDGQEFRLSPHDLRRTYARSLFQDYGMPIEGIQEQMGHNDIKTTRLYIGALDLDFRTPSKR